MIITGKIARLETASFENVELEIKGNTIVRIDPTSSVSNQYILPGFIDAHVHIESSMLLPSEFARMAVVHGTVGTVSDPHEIANVLGNQGVHYMIENGKKVPFHFAFGAPSCVPATAFETAGSEIGLEELEKLLQSKDIIYLAEMMNWPGVLNQDPLVMKKLNLAKKYGKPIDGHAPGLMGEQALKYINAGISTDHECFTRQEAAFKLQQGMKVIIREGSAARNFEALIDLANQYPDQMMFCSDDKHPDSLEEGHINTLIKRGLKKGIDLFSLLKMASKNPIEHYGMAVGQLKIGDSADFTIVESLESLNIHKTYIKGELVAEKGESLISRVSSKIINRFEAAPIDEVDLKIPAKGEKIKVIQVIDKQLITESREVEASIVQNFIEASPEEDILKIAVINRYQPAVPALGFIRGFGIKQGAIASSVAHDCHNIIAVGSDDFAITQAINMIIEQKGGLAAWTSQNQKIIPLEIGGLMTRVDGYEISQKYTELDQMVKKMGSPLTAPFMSLSFMALLVIPSLKLSDKGLFDGQNFTFTPLNY